MTARTTAAARGDRIRAGGDTVNLCFSTLQARNGTPRSAVFALFLAASLVAFARGGVAAPLFIAPFISSDVGDVRGVTAADVNGDTHPDLVTADEVSGTVS